MLTWGHVLAIVAIVVGVMTAFIAWCCLRVADNDDDEATTGWE